VFSGDGSGCEEDSETGKGLRRRKRNGITPRGREEVMLNSVSPMAVSRLIRRELWAHVE